MSLTKTLKDTQEQLETVQGELAQASEERDNVTAQLVTAQTDHEAALAALKETHEQELATLRADHVDVAEALSQAQSEMARLDHELSTASEQLAAAQEKLKNPAYTDASTEGQGPVADGGDGMTDIVAQFDAITDQKEKMRFYREHKGELFQAQREQG